MTSAPQPLSAQEFSRADGAQDWRLLFRGVCTHVPTGSYPRSIELAGAIGRACEPLGAAPDLDVRAEGVTVQLLGEDALAETLVVARAVSEVVRDLGLAADPSGVQLVQVAVDVHDLAAVMPFWQAVLGYDEVWDEDLADPHRRNPPIWFQQVDRHRPGRGRVHLDVSIPHDQGEVRVAAAVAAGGKVVLDRYAPAWWTLEDPEGNLVDVATWQGRD